MPAAGSIMTGIWALATLWLGLALVASLLSIWFQIATAIWCGRWRPIFSSSGRLAILRPEVGVIQLAPCPILVVK